MTQQSKTTKILRSMKEKPYEPKTAISEGIYIPNHSGIAVHPEAKNNFLSKTLVDVGVGLSLTGDNSTADTIYVPNVLFNTDATPPAANTVPIGTIYIQYTA